MLGCTAKRFAGIGCLTRDEKRIVLIRVALVSVAFPESAIPVAALDVDFRQDSPVRCRFAREVTTSGKLSCEIIYVEMRLT